MIGSRHEPDRALLARLDEQGHIAPRAIERRDGQAPKVLQGRAPEHAHEFPQRLLRVVWFHLASASHFEREPLQGGREALADPRDELAGEANELEVQHTWKQVQQVNDPIEIGTKEWVMIGIDKVRSVDVQRREDWKGDSGEERDQQFRGVFKTVAYENECSEVQGGAGQEGTEGVYVDLMCEGRVELERLQPGRSRLQVEGKDVSPVKYKFRDA
mgnify:CR=1 FL=1